MSWLRQGGWHCKSNCWGVNLCFPCYSFVKSHFCALWLWQTVSNTRRRYKENTILSTRSRKMSRSTRWMRMIGWVATHITVSFVLNEMILPFNYDSFQKLHQLTPPPFCSIFAETSSRPNDHKVKTMKSWLYRQHPEHAHLDIRSISRECVYIKWVQGQGNVIKMEDEVDMGNCD